MPKGIRLINEYIKYENYTVLQIIGSIYGDFDFIIDNEDVEKVKKAHWSVMQNKREYPDGSQKVYYYATNGTKPTRLLHRYIMDNPIGLVVDHKGGNTFDTRKQNLDVCTTKENNRKSGLSCNNKSGRQGVLYDTNLKTPRWMAFIWVDWKRKHIGYFDTFEEACKARKEAEVKYYGKYIPINVKCE